MRVACILSLAVGGLPLLAACNQSARPGPEAVSPAATSTAQPDEPKSDPASADPDAATSPTAPAPSGSAPGDLALPAGSAKVWNNAQSDGNAPTGDRGLDDYRTIVQNNRDKFRRCYEVSLKAHPGIKGNVTLKFVLTPTGAVKEAFIDKSASDITEADLETCMVAVLKTLPFPASKRGMESTVRYPFNFNPHAQSASSR